MTHRRHVLVVGGGITGLAAAYRLSQQAEQVTLVESAQRLGGKVGTERVEGFLIERGPDSFMTATPQAWQLAEELGVELVPVRAGGAPALLLGDALRPLPEGMSGFMPRRALPLARSELFSPFGKCRMALELVVPPRRDDEDESLEQFTTRRLGRQAYDRLVEPVTAGIFSGDPSQLSVLATMPHLRAAEARHGGLIRAMLAERRAARGSSPDARSGAGPAVVAPAEGMGALVDALALQLAAAEGVDVRLGTTVDALRRTPAGYLATLRCAGAVSTLAVDALVLAVPGTAAAGILRGIGAGDIGRELTGIPQASTVTVSLGYRRQDVPSLARRLPGHGYLIAGEREGPARAVTWSSAKLPYRAPEGHELLRVSLGGARRPSVAALTDQEVVAAARDELAQTLGIRTEPIVTVAHRWIDLMPQYTVGHPDRVARIERALRSHPSVVLAGSSLHGLGVPDCIASGARAAAAVTPQLGTLA